MGLEGLVGGQSQKNFFGPFGPQLIWSKNKGPLGGLPWIRHWIFPPNVACFFLSVNSVRIGQNLLNELPKMQSKRSILADFANYHLNSLNGKLNGSRKNNIDRKSVV